MHRTPAGGPKDRGLVAAGAPDVSVAPPPAADAPRADSGAAATSSGGGGSSGGDEGGAARAAWRRLLRELSSLPRAIAIMASIAALSGIGTVIPQNKVHARDLERMHALQRMRVHA